MSESQKQKQPEKTRNSGLDLYRIIAIVFITTLHVVNQHLGMMESSNRGIFYLGWFLEFFCYCGVNCFALCSGYLMIHSNQKYTGGWFSKLLMLSLKCFFYSIGIFLALYLSGIIPLPRAKLLLKYFFMAPFLWWYISAYIGTFIFIPFFNAGFTRLSASAQFKFLIVLFLFFSVFSLLPEQDPFKICGGYSILWLTICYFWGGFIRLHQEQITAWISSRSAFLITVAIPLADFLYFAINLNTVDKGKKLFLSYSSPIMLLESVFLLIFCCRITVKSKRCAKILEWISAMSLGVYLFQAHPGIWKIFFIKDPRYFIGDSLLEVLWKLPVIVCGILAVGCCIDQIREILFKILKIKTLCRKMDDIWSRFLFQTEKWIDEKIEK